MISDSQELPSSLSESPDVAFSAESSDHENDELVREVAESSFPLRGIIEKGNQARSTPAFSSASRHKTKESPLKRKRRTSDVSGVRADGRSTAGAHASTKTRHNMDLLDPVEQGWFTEAEGRSLLRT